MNLQLLSHSGAINLLHTVHSRVLLWHVIEAVQDVLCPASEFRTTTPSHGGCVVVQGLTLDRALPIRMLQPHPPCSNATGELAPLQPPT